MLYNQREACACVVQGARSLDLLFVPSEGSEAPLHPHPVNRPLFVVVGYIIPPAPSNKNLLTTPTSNPLGNHLQFCAPLLG